MKLGLDFDDTVTRAPEFFSLLAQAVKEKGGEVYIVSSRTDTQDVRDKTARELASHDIPFDEMSLFAYTNEEMRDICPHKELDGYQKWLWQKVDYCRKHKIDVFFDDDEKVVDLFTKYVPEIIVFRPGKKNRTDGL